MPKYKQGTIHEWDIMTSEGFFIEAGIKAFIRRKYFKKKQHVINLFSAVSELFFKW